MKAQNYFPKKLCIFNPSLIPIPKCRTHNLAQIPHRKCAILVVQSLKKGIYNNNHQTIC
nr:MAG TPA: hypothetical protein [Bacteriophage sp.]